MEEREKDKENKPKGGVDQTNKPRVRLMEFM